MRLSCTVSKTNVDFGWNTQVFSYPVYLRVASPLRGYPWNFANQDDGSTARQKVWKFVQPYRASIGKTDGQKWQISITCCMPTHGCRLFFSGESDTHCVQKNNILFLCLHCTQTGRLLLKVTRYKANKLWGRPPQYAPPLQVDLWPFDRGSGVRVTCDVGYLCANFSLPRPVVDLGPMYGTDTRETDVRRASSLNAPTLEAGA